MAWITLKELRDMEKDYPLFKGSELPLCPECEKHFGSDGYLTMLRAPQNVLKQHKESNPEKETVRIYLSCFMDSKYIHYHGHDFGLPKTSNVLTHEADRYGRKGATCPLVNRGDNQN